MPSILEEARKIVADRERAYDIIVSDFYYMATLARDQEMQNHIWQEALRERNGHLLALLVSIDMELAKRHL